MSHASILHHLATVIDDRRTADPSTSYVAKLLNSGQDKILKKVGEEAAET
ncbi:MAG TPA: phosphoribosyl-ATP diphosphatase, partial [Nitrosomonas sp.]|nr:phosphoribosyl-ATP diphosphatase [Nitrosomonas sp.]